MERPAIGTGNGLNGKMFARARAAGDADLITALATLERIGAAHTWRSLD